VEFRENFEFGMGSDLPWLTVDLPRGREGGGVKRVVFLLCMLQAFSAWAAPVRSWSFAQDTVHEWVWDSLSGWYGTDTLFVVNNSTDTLRFDSSAAEIISPPGVFSQGAIEAAPRSTGGGGIIAYAPPQLSYIYEFTILQDDFFFPPQSKGGIFRLSLDATQINDSVVVHDSLVFRLILYSGQTSDTAYIRGGACCVSPIFFPVRAAPARIKQRYFHDLRGRKIIPHQGDFLLKEP
jgi:hypothetical protein